MKPKEFEWYGIIPGIKLGNATEDLDGSCTVKDAKADVRARQELTPGAHVIWTLYGFKGVNAWRIGEFDSFEDAHGIMQAILEPMRKACEEHYSAKLDFICKKSTNEERI